MTMNRVIDWWIKGVLLAGLLLLAGLAGAKDVNSASALKSALGGKASVNGNVVTLTENVELSEKITITGGDIILDLAGKSIYNKWGSWNLSGSNRKKIDIFDVEGGTLTIQGSGSVYNQGTGENSAIWVNGGTLNVKANIRSEKYSAIAFDKGSLNIFSGDISSEDSKEALDVKGGTVNINGGRVYNESSGKNAVQVTGGKLILTSGYIYSKEESGTVDRDMCALLQKDGVVIVNGGTLEASKNRYGAFGVKVEGGSFFMNGGEIKATAIKDISNLQEGYGLSITGGKVQLKKGTITGTNTNDSQFGRAISSNQPFSDILVKGYGIYRDGSLLSMEATATDNGTVEIKLVEYKIEYYEQNGSVINDSSLPKTFTIESSNISIPNLSDKEHYTFSGWRLTSVTDGKPTKNYVLKPQDYIRDVRLTAIFEPKQYQIIYNRNGGTNMSGNPDTYTVETEMELGDPSRDDYDFEGWYTDANFTKPFLKFEKQFYGNPLALYAKWSPTKYDVTLYNGDTKYEKWGDLHRTVEKGVDLFPYQPTRDGYLFIGWSTDKEGKNILNAVPAGSENINLYAQWKIVSFVIKYNTDGGTTFPDEQYTLETKDDNNWKTGVHVKKNGYVFRGWFLKSDFSGNPLTGFPLNMNWGTPSVDKSVITINLYAKWEVQDYSIVFQNAGDEFIDNKKYNIKEGISEKDMPQPTWIGRKFLGWFNENDELMKSVPPGTGNLILSAKWELVKYKITYETNGGNISGEQLEYTIVDHVKLVTPTKEHYTFTGWYTQKEGGEKYMQDEFQSQTGDKVVYAHWTPKTYHLSFVTNGGSKIEGSFPFTYGEVIDIDKRTYRQAYTFEGWYLDVGFTKKYDKNTSGSIGSDLTLYAKWAPTRYKIKYDMFHGVAIPDDSYSTEEEKELPVNAIRDGFSFAGWYADVMLTNGPVKKIEKGSSGDKTFYATWKRGNFIHFLTPENGTIKVMRRGKELASGDMVGTDVELEISAIPVSERYRLKSLSIGDKTYTTSPQTVRMPESDLHIFAVFEDARTVASAPEIITDPENTDNMLAGTIVKVTLKKTDENTTLYYSISDSPRRPYEGPFEMSSETSKLVILKAYAVKEGCKDGVTVRDMGFGVQKVMIAFNLPVGMAAVNPLGGEVVSAIASGGAFEFSLEVDKSYFQSLDSMVVLANDSVLTTNAKGIYRVEGVSKDVTITVDGVEKASYEVTLEQSDYGRIYFTEDGSEDPLTLSRSQQVSVTAVPDLNYKFGGWSDGSQSNPYRLLVTSDTTLTAIFVPDAQYYTITLPVLEGVTVKPLSNYSTEVLRGGKFHFYLRLADGYSAENQVVKANGVVLEANADGVYSLYKVAQNYSISVDGVVKDGVKLKLADYVSAIDLATATDAMKAKLYSESMVSLLATAPDGQYFYKWNDGNSDNPRIVTVREASGLLPLFQPRSEDKNYAKIQLPNVAGAGVGVQVDVHSIEVGGKMPFKVVLLPEYSQSEVKVIANGKLLEEGLSMRAASKSRTLVYSLANVEKDVKIEISGLKLNTYHVGVEQSEGGRTSVSPSGQVEYGKQVTFTATPDNGNMFVKWSDGNTLNPYPLSVNSDMNLKAVFMRSDMAVANEDVALSDAHIYVRAGKLYVETAKDSPLYVWDYKGVLFYALDIPAGTYSCPLPAGIYVVKIGKKQSEKVLVR